MFILSFIFYIMFGFTVCYKHLLHINILFLNVIIKLPIGVYI